MKWDRNGKLETQMFSFKLKCVRPVHKFDTQIFWYFKITVDRVGFELTTSRNLKLFREISYYTILTTQVKFYIS